MAKLAFAAPVSGLRGKVGGVIYSANKAGPYLKPWGRSSNPQAVAQVAQRNALATLAKDWSSITPAQRTAWDTYAALPAQDFTDSLGATYSASGFNWYIKINCQLLSVGDVATPTAPVLVRPTAPTNRQTLLRVSSSVNDSLVRVFIAEFAGMALVLSTRYFPNSDRLVFPNREFLTFTIKPVIADNNFIQTELETLFGDIALGGRGFFWLYRQDAQGQRSLATTTVVDSIL